METRNVAVAGLALGLCGFAACDDKGGSSSCREESSAGAKPIGYNLNTGDFACEEEDAIVDPFHMNAVSFNIAATGTPGTTAIHSAFDAADGQWNAAGAEVAITRGSDDSTITKMDPEDSHHSLFMGGVHPYEIGWTAATQCYPDPDWEDCDTQVYTKMRRTATDEPESLSWNATSGSGVAGKYSLRRVFAHELGHALGLDHPDEGYYASSIMAIEIEEDVIDSGATFSASSIATVDKGALKYIYGVP